MNERMYERVCRYVTTLPPLVVSSIRLALEVDKRWQYGLASTLHVQKKKYYVLPKLTCTSLVKNYRQSTRSQVRRGGGKKPDIRKRSNKSIKRGAKRAGFGAGHNLARHQD